MDRYVDPLVTNLKNMLSYRKFRRGPKSEVDDQLRKEKLENPMRIVYSFGISHDHPGTFVLSYIRSSNPHHEYVGLYPKGFRFRKRDFEDLDRLVAYFQKNIDKPPPESGPSIQTVAAKVPMKSPAWGYSSDGLFGGSTGSNDGWNSQTPDREMTSTPGSRGGRSDYRGRGGRDGHPSGLPRPGRGRGRGNNFGNGGRGRGNNFGNGGRGSDQGNSKWGSNSDQGNSKWGSNSDQGNSKWGSNSNDDDGLSSFPGAKVQNSPGRERFPGGWGSGGGGWGNTGGGENAGLGGKTHLGEKSSPGGWGSGGGGWGTTGGGENAGLGGKTHLGEKSSPGGWGSGGGGWGTTGGGENAGLGGGTGGWGGGSSGDGGGWGGGSSGDGGGRKLVPPQGDGGRGGSKSGGGWD